MKSVLLYYPFRLAENANSGSKLRPIEIHRAFKQWGEREKVEILLLSGTSAERDAMFDEWKQQGKLDDIWFCYMENQTIPFWLTDPGHKPQRPFVDTKVMKFLKSRRVPVGVFYRDVYWKFDELYPLKGIKKAVMKTIYRMEEKFYDKYCQAIFLPSDAMGAYVDIPREKIALPPGGKYRGSDISTVRSPGVKKGLYVGGINNEDYGLFLLLEAMDLANSEQEILNLTIVCREDEFEKLSEKKKELIMKKNVQVKHISGETLDELYKEMDFAFIPRYKSTYNDFSVPVKLVEYLSNDLPLVATNCEAQKQIIEEDGYGIICEDNPESMAKAIKNMAEQSDSLRENIMNSFMKKHSWLARVEKVKNTLVKEEL
ncbi:glycosyltransferase family 4 protein [Bacillus infantis]|uniref:Glycosyltransferase family 4 protein n=1 Tax=Bacillus infantis TaxID=324767 RepID=A0A5D4SJZ1_9BACI|nr:glycosyltransferase [Bacillus infantis]TYS63775.1 glycosyltransferase family 4 protein [Bacillus infantis]